MTTCPPASWNFSVVHLAVKATPSVPNSEKQAIGKALKHPETLTATLAKYHINYVLLARDDDSDSYSYLDTQPGVRQISANDSLILYEVAR